MLKLTNDLYYRQIIIPRNIIRNTLDDIFSNVLHSDKDLYIGCELKTKKSKKYERKAFRVDKIYDILRLFTKSVG